MEAYIDHFDEPVAATYDADEASMFAPEIIARTIKVLAELARAGSEDCPSALEFAIGTGRVAVPLLEAGVAVDGIDLSTAMLRQLRAKPGADGIRTLPGSFTEVDMGADYDLVYLVFNTIGNVTTQDGQVECFANAARHLRPGGYFVVENIVPRLRELTPGSNEIVFHASEDHVGVDVYTDLVRQQAVSRHFFKGEEADAFRHGETPFRYTWPSELDLMARLAGMSLVHRWADWDRSPLTGESGSHVSVWQLGEPA